MFQNLAKTLSQNLQRSNPLTFKLKPSKVRTFKSQTFSTQTLQKAKTSKPSKVLTSQAKSIPSTNTSKFHTLPLLSLPKMAAVHPLRSFTRLVEHLTALRLVHAMSAWSLKTRHDPSQHRKGARVYRRARYECTPPSHRRLLRSPPPIGC